MPRKTIKSLENKIAECRELRVSDGQSLARLDFELSDYKKRLKDVTEKYDRLYIEYDWIKRLCQSLSEAIRAIS